MVELVIASILLVPALVLLFLGFTGKPWAGLFSGLLLLIFGVLLLGSGFQYGGGVALSSSGVTQFKNVTYNYQNFSEVTDNFNNLGVLQTFSTTNVPVMISSNETLTTSGNQTSSSNFTTTKTDMTDATSILFMFLGITVFALSLFVMNRTRNTLVTQNGFESEEE